MTFDEAVSILCGAGLIVEPGPGLELMALADPRQADDSSGASGVMVAYRFGFSIWSADGGWFLRASSPGPAERYAELDAAVMQGLRLYHQHRDVFSPELYADQFARFEAKEPLRALEQALVAAGWLKQQDQLNALGLTFVSGAKFTLHFPDQRRIVVVCVDPDRCSAWQLSVRCYREAKVRGAAPVPVRARHSDGSPITDSVAPSLSFQVASVLHRSLATVASNIRWALHHTPDEGRQRHEPVPPA